MKDRPIGYLEPLVGESISHYLGRYRRQPIVSVSSSISLGLGTECGSTFYRWEHFFFNPRPSTEEIQLVGSVLGLTEKELIRLLPDGTESVNIQPIRLCAACYRKTPWHLLVWQYKSCIGCRCHGLRLLSSCPSCNEPFPLPVVWQSPMKCRRCSFSFSKMNRKQIQYLT